ncbi:MAG: hypothetical protein ABDH49_01775 [Candidatus Hydrothermales bacterium]
MKIIILIFSFMTFDYVRISYTGVEALQKDNHFFKSFETSKIFFRPIFNENLNDKFLLASGYTSYFLDIYTVYLSLSFKKLPIALFSFNAGKFEETDTSGFKTGRVITPTHLGFIIGAPFVPQKKLFDLEKGLSLKIFYVKLKEFSSFAFALDFSILKAFYFNNLPFKASLDLRNIGIPTNRKASSLPYELSFSLSSELKNKIKSFIPSLGFSVEKNLFSYRISSLLELNRFISLAMNFDSRRRETAESEGLHRVVTGFGLGIFLKVKKVSTFYSFIPSGIFQDLHKVDLQISF